MKPIALLASVIVAGVLSACGVTTERFPGAVVAPPADLSGQWQMELQGQTSIFVLTPSAPNHYQVRSPTAAGPAQTMDARIQLWRDTHYLVVAEPGAGTGASVFRVLDFTPASLRIAALDPRKTEAVLKERGMPVTYRKMWLYDEIVLSGAALHAVLAADAFALDAPMTLRRQ
jgi:hypothetical protein